MSKSIMQEKKECYICKTTLDLDKHHCIHGTANRKLADKDGLWVYLCTYHHTMSNEAVHQNSAKDRKLKEIAQAVWESKLGTREEFIKRYGKSYL